jgi:DNA-binding IclR family transcriptional regulator
MNHAALRALEVLEAVASSTVPLTMDQIITGTGISKATAYRTVGGLSEAGILLREPKGRFSAGPRLGALGLSLISNGAFRSERQSILQSLVSQVGETCNFTTLHNNDVVYIERVESSWPLKLSLHPGSVVPLHCTSSGKLYLSQMPVAQRTRLLRSAPIPRFTPHTITDPDQLDQELRQIRKTRVSTDNEGYLAGLISVAVPVYGPDKKVIGAVSVHALAARLSLERALTFLPQIRRAAADLGAAYRRLSAPREAERSTSPRTRPV